MKLKNYLQKKICETYENCGFQRIFTPIIEDIENQPAADVTLAVHAHWIRQDETFTRFKCTECGIENCNGFENYCPNCGAKMDEGKGGFIE